jgi:hypothetical protein
VEAIGEGSLPPSRTAWDEVKGRGKTGEFSCDRGGSNLRVVPSTWA